MLVDAAAFGHDPRSLAGPLKSQPTWTLHGLLRNSVEAAATQPGGPHRLFTAHTGTCTPFLGTVCTPHDSRWRADKGALAK